MLGTAARSQEEIDLPQARPALKCFAAILCLKSTHLTDESGEARGRKQYVEIKYHVGVSKRYLMSLAQKGKGLES